MGTASRVRVLHVQRIGGIGGSERHLLTLLPALAQRRIDVRFLGLDDPSGAPDPFYEELSVGYERLLAPRDVDPMLAVRVARSIRRTNPDLVHTHLVHADVYGAATSRRLVSTKHNDDRFRTGPFRFVERALARRAAKVIAITDALARFQIERVGLPARKLTTIHYGLDALPEPWGRNPPDDVPRDAVVVLAICRLEPQKGVDMAVRAVALLRERRADVHLVVLGEGNERAGLEALARELDVPVYLPGRVPDVAAWLRRAKVLVHPVRWEGFGLAVLEAMLAGLPVVASRVSSLPELVVDGETGLLVPPDDAHALARGIETALGDGARLGEAGRGRAHERFSVSRMADATLAVYEGVTSAARRSERTRHPPPTQEKGGAEA
jgi:glycosyltransferase involved in cell wall biosynthesis